MKTILLILSLFIIGSETAVACDFESKEPLIIEITGL